MERIDMRKNHNKYRGAHMEKEMNKNVEERKRT